MGDKISRNILFLVLPWPMNKRKFKLLSLFLHFFDNFKRRKNYLLFASSRPLLAEFHEMRLLNKTFFCYDKKRFEALKTECKELKRKKSSKREREEDSAE